MFKPFRSAHADFNVLFSSQENLNFDQSHIYQYFRIALLSPVRKDLLRIVWNMEVYEHCAVRLSYNLRLNKISKLIFFQCPCKIIRNQLEIILEVTYELHINKYFKITNLKREGGSLVMKRFALYSNFWRMNKIISETR